MLIALGLLCPIWIPLIGHQEKHRRIFFKRWFMDTLPGSWIERTTRRMPGRIWIHALSVGEVLSAEPLVQALAQQYGAFQLLFSTSTQTGFEMARQVIAPHVYALRFFPYDTLISVNRALEVIQPRQVVIVETDLWPNLLTCLKKRRIPVYLVNARLSKRSFNGYRRAAFLMAPLLSIFDRICVQTETDRLRFRALGVPQSRLVMVGNIKFDQAPINMSSDEIVRLTTQFNLAVDAPIWVAGSTHDGEEEILSRAYQRVCASGIKSLLLVAPRDPTRATDVCRIFQRRGIDAVSLDQRIRQTGSPQVVVVDRIGLLRHLYALAELAFVGGSLVQAGGHNPLEPAAVAKPILCGPHTDDFAWIYQSLENAGGAVRVQDAEQLSAQVSQLIRNKAKNRWMGRRAYNVFAQNSGAVARTQAAIGMTADR